MPEKVQEVIAKVRPMLLLLLSLVLVAIPALSVSCIRQASTYTDITPAEAYEMINQQEVVLLDVCTQEEYDFCHIPDALLIPLSELESRLDELNPSDHIFVYHSCSCTSKKAVQILVNNGFLHIYNLRGGISRWQAQGFPIT